MNQVFLAYVIYNVDDGPDTYNIGVYQSFEKANKALLNYIKEDEMKFDPDEVTDIKGKEDVFSYYSGYGTQAAGIDTVNAFLDY